jgi:hypothetical protein
VDDKQQEPKQQTPRGYEIPVPKRGKVLSDLRELAQAVKKPKR